MRVLYLDCFSGISGDMTLGALLSLGADKDKLVSELRKLKLQDEFKIVSEDKICCGISGVSADVIVKNQDKFAHNHTHYSQIRRLLEKSDLKTSAKKRALFMFSQVAKAEALVHGKDIGEIAFHEVGAVDSIIDIAGTAILLDELNIDCIMHSPVNVGGGTVKCAHGILPVPAPATSKILEGVTIYGEANVGELTTPTGAAILKLCEEGEALPKGRITAEGFGFGKKEIGRVNALRALIIETDFRENSDVYEFCANIDDMTPEELSFAAKMIFSAGALDVWITPITMKKGRAAVKLSALSALSEKENIINAFREYTTTLGVRYEFKQRQVFDRKFASVNTKYGIVTVKNSCGRLHAEYDDCEAAAIKNNISIREVANEAVFLAAKGENE